MRFKENIYSIWKKQASIDLIFLECMVSNQLELCKTGAYQKINEILLTESYLKGKIDSSCCNIDTKDVVSKKRV